jgi:hypothetical protein
LYTTTWRPLLRFLSSWACRRTQILWPQPCSGIVNTILIVPMLRPPCQTAVTAQKSYFQDATHYSENLRSLGSTCNEIHLTNGSSLFGGVSCTSDSSDACPSVLYRYKDGRNETAVCPTGTEMVVSAMGAVGDVQYQFSPSPGVEIASDLPDGCSLVGAAYLCDAGIVTLRFTASGDLACDIRAGDSGPEPSFGIPYGTCGGVCQFGPETDVPPATEAFSRILDQATDTPSKQFRPFLFIGTIYR